MKYILARIIITEKMHLLYLSNCESHWVLLVVWNPSLDNKCHTISHVFYCNVKQYSQCAWFGSLRMELLHFTACLVRLWSENKFLLER